MRNLKELEKHLPYLKPSWMIPAFGFLMGVIGLLIGVFLSSCTPAYPQCATTDVTKFRCNGDVIEMCDGQTWSPRINCKEQWNEDGELVPQECVESGGDAECE